MTERSRIQCLDRAMDILEAVARLGEAGVTQLARETDLHVATVHNILSTLAGRGYLSADDGRYRLGPALGALSWAWEPAQLLSRLLPPVLLRVAREGAGAPLAAVLLGSSLRIIASTLEMGSISVQSGGPVISDPLSYATGRVLVAAGPEGSWEAFVQQRRAALPKAADPSDWPAELKNIREQGYALMPAGEANYSLAVPIRSGSGTVLAALGICCSRTSDPPEDWPTRLSILQGAAAELEGAI